MRSTIFEQEHPTGRIVLIPQTLVINPCLDFFVFNSCYHVLIGRVLDGFLPLDYLVPRMSMTHNHCTVQHIFIAAFLPLVVFGLSEYLFLFPLLKVENVLKKNI